MLSLLALGLRELSQFKTQASLLEAREKGEAAEKRRKARRPFSSGACETFIRKTNQINGRKSIHVLKKN